jgi:hypothetical protein
MQQFVCVLSLIRFHSEPRSPFSAILLICHLSMCELVLSFGNFLQTLECDLAVDAYQFLLRKVVEWRRLGDDSNLFKESWSIIS